MTTPFRKSGFLPLILCALLAAGGGGCTKGIRKARHLARGEREFKAQHYDMAEIEYLNVLKVAPMEPTAIRQLGLIYQEEGKIARAHAFLLKASQLEPTNLDVLSKLAINSLSIGDFKTATEQANAVLAKQPGHTEALEILAGSAVTSNMLQQAQQQIEKLRQSDQDRAGYHVAFGTLALRRQDITNAETEFKQALQLDPNSTSALLALGNIYWVQKDLTAADQTLQAAAKLSPVRSGKRLKYAEFQLLNAKVEDARRTVEQITKEAPDYIPAWSFLAQIAFGEKKYDESHSLLQRVMARDPSNYDGLMLSANLRLVKGETDKALADLRQMATFYPRAPQVQFQLARAFLLNNDLPKAQASLDKAIAIDPNFADAILLQANLNLRKGDSAQTILSLTDLIKRQPLIAQAYVLLTEAYVAKNDNAQAVAVSRRMVEVFPKAPDVQMLLGALLVRQNEFNEARRAFEKALELAPDYLPGVEQLMNLDLNDKNYAAATERVQKEIDKFPKQGEPWLLMGRIHLAQAGAMVEAENKRNSATGPKLRLGDVPAAQPEVGKAEAALLKAIELNPALRNGYLMLSDLYIASGKQQQALDRLNSLLSKTNDVVALMQVGILHESAKEYPAAKDAYERLLTINTNFSPALNNLAYIYCERIGDLDKAYQLAERARQLLPYDPAPADTLGWILYRRGEYNRAVTLLEESASKLSNEPEVQFHLGMAEYMLGNEDAARSALQLAVKGTKDFTGKDEAARRLVLLGIDPRTAGPEVVADLQKQLQSTPRDPIALERLGSIQERDGAFDKAAETYQTALKYNPQDSALTLKLADLYSSHLNDPQRALALAKSAHDQAPDNARISALLGHLVLQNGDSQWAASLLEDSVRKLPEDPQVSFDLGWAYYSLGRVPEAQQLMQNAAKAGPAFKKAPEAQQFLAAVEAANDPARTKAFAAEAQKILGTDANYVPALMISAAVQQQQGNLESAAATYNNVLARFPSFSPARRNLGLLCFSRGDDDKAYELLNKVRENFPQDGDVAKGLGVLTCRKGNYTRAAQLLQESLQSRKDDPETLYYLGKAQYELKAKSESKASLKKALEFNLPDKLADDARRLLAELK